MYQYSEPSTVFTGLFNAFVPFSCSQAWPNWPHNYLNQLMKDHLACKPCFELSFVWSWQLQSPWFDDPRFASWYSNKMGFPIAVEDRRQFNGYHQTGNTNPSMPVSVFLMRRRLFVSTIFSLRKTLYTKECTQGRRHSVVVSHVLRNRFSNPTSQPLVQRIFSPMGISEDQQMHQGLSTWEFEGLGGWVNNLLRFPLVLIIGWIIPWLTECSLR